MFKLVIDNNLVSWYDGARSRSLSRLSPFAFLHNQWLFGKQESMTENGCNSIQDCLYLMQIRKEVSERQQENIILILISTMQGHYLNYQLLTKILAHSILRIFFATSKNKKPFYLLYFITARNIFILVYMINQ